MSDYPLLILGNLSAGPQLLERLNPTILDIYSRLGSAVASCTEWLEGGLAVAYVGGDEFSLAGDATGIFPAGRMVRATLEAGYAHEAVLSSSYDDVAEVTTVTLASGVLDSTLSGISPGILAPGADSALPTIIGKVRTFTSFPVGPSEAPTSDYEFANKKLVDDEVAGLRADLAAAHSADIQGLLRGLDCAYASASSITISLGAIEINGVLYEVTATLTKTELTGLSNNQWYAILAQAPAEGTAISASDISLDEIMPTEDGVKNGWYDVAGTGRMIGVLLTDGSGNIIEFYTQDGLFRLPNPASFRSAGPSGNAATPTLIPVGGPSLGRLEVDIHALATGSSGNGSRLNLGDGDQDSPDLNNSLVAYSGIANGLSGHKGWHHTNTSGQIYYWVASASYCYLVAQLCGIKLEL